MLLAQQNDIGTCRTQRELVDGLTGTDHLESAVRGEKMVERGGDQWLRIDDEQADLAGHQLAYHDITVFAATLAQGQCAKEHTSSSYALTLTCALDAD
jgi:hypothetical protein